VCSSDLARREAADSSSHNVTIDELRRRKHATSAPPSADATTPDA
jgi:hypothetical protein